jgi:quercetin dioxygenase-like cupin family protein
MALHVRNEEMTDGSIVVDADQGGLSTRSVYGNQVSMTVATREPGYHSIPHYHAIEQLTYVVSGQTWMFIGEHGFVARPGDFFRVPSGEVHWSWNTGDEPLVTFQCFAPILDPETNDGAVGLYDDGETPDIKDPGRNITPEDAAHHQELERRAMGDEYPAGA